MLSEQNDKRKPPKHDFSHYVGLSFHEWGCNQADMIYKYRSLKEITFEKKIEKIKNTNSSNTTTGFFSTFHMQTLY